MDYDIQLHIWCDLRSVLISFIIWDFLFFKIGIGIVFLHVKILRAQLELIVLLLLLIIFVPGWLF